MVKINYKGETRNVPASYLKGLKGKERRDQIKSIIEGKDRPETSVKSKRSGWAKKFDKGRGAYYSSGSRPNQTAESWALARLASVIMNGGARKVDKNIWEKYSRK